MIGVESHAKNCWMAKKQYAVILEVYQPLSQSLALIAFNINSSVFIMVYF